MKHHINIASLTGILATFISYFVLPFVYSRAKVVTQSKSSRKPKAYFQFWAFHVFAIVLVMYTIGKNFERGNIILAMLIVVAFFGTILGLLSPSLDIETPTHCCRCCHSFSHGIVLWIAVCTSLLIISFALFTIPTIMFVYYLYPARTLLRLPLLTNAVLYINSLLALLLFQCERLFYPCMKKKNNTDHRLGYCKLSCGRLLFKLGLYNKLIELYRKYRRFAEIEDPPLKKRNITHKRYYRPYYMYVIKYQEKQKKPKTIKTKKRLFVRLFVFSCFLIGTVIALGILILFIIIIHDLSDFHISSVKDLNLNLLLTLAPTLLLSFVSFYKHNLFYDFKDEVEESKKELLLKEIVKQEKLILEKLEKIHPATELEVGNEDRQLDASDTTQDDETEDDNEDRQLDTSDTTQDDETEDDNEDRQLDASDTTQDDETEDDNENEGTGLRLIQSQQATGNTTQETRHEATRDATGDTDVITAPFATESDITPATGGEATVGAVSGEITPLIVNHKPDDYKTIT